MRNILIFSLIVSFLIRIFFIFNGKHLADIWHISRMGEVLLSGQNPYLVLDFNVYPPLSVFLSALSLMIGQFVSIFFPIPFHMVIKIWPNLADFIIAFIIYRHLKSRIGVTAASIWSAFFILNPISIIISSSHGQLDSITSLLVILSILSLILPKQKITLSASLLGLAIAFKPNPMILIPLFLFYLKTPLTKKISFLIYALTPLVVSLIPLLLKDPDRVVLKLISYSGVYDFSYAAILRGIWYQINAQPTLPVSFSDQLLQSSKFVLIAASFSLTLLANRQNLIKAVLAIYLTFFCFYFGISAQYLVWVIPLAILARDKMVIFYSLTGFLSLLGFYLFFGPDVLLGKLTEAMPFQRKYIYLYFYANLAFWIICLWWLFRIISGETVKVFLKLGKVRQVAILLSFVLFSIALSSLVQILLRFIDLYQAAS